MRTIALVALLSLAGAARAEEAMKAHKDELKRLEKIEQKYWDDFQRAYNDALTALAKPSVDAAAKPNEAINAALDFTAVRNLYEDHARIEEAKGKADLALGASADPKALAELLETLFAVAKRIDEVDAELLGAKSQQRGYRFDQRPSIERHGLSLRLDALVRALAQCPLAPAHLGGEGMKSAAKRDGRRSIVRRVALLDALGLCAGEEAISALAPFATAPESSLRIAAAEALLRHGAAARAAVVPLLTDPCPPVRRALLQAIASTGAADPGWIAPVLGAYERAQGVVREDCVRALEALTGQRFGDAIALWQEWFADYKAEIEGGKFRKDAIEVRDAKPEPPQAACTFYGIPTPSRRVVFVVEGSRRLLWPADLSIQLTKYKEFWHQLHKTWAESYPSHKEVLLRQFDRAGAAFAPDLSFGVVGLYGPFVADSLCGPKLLQADKRDLRTARREIEKLPADGGCAPYEGLLAAAQLAGMGPESDADFPEARADTVYLWCAGDCGTGRYMLPEAAVAAFRRFNRFRRLVVHAIRISDEGPPSEAFLKGVAEATGGAYLWASKPPP